MSNEDTPQKPLTNIEKYNMTLTPDERAALRAKATVKRKEAAERKRRDRAELMKKAEALIPEIVAHDILNAEHRDFQPKQETIDKLKAMLSDGKLSIEETRKKYFAGIKDDAWKKLMKFVFKSHVSQVEDVGLELVEAKRKALRSLEGHLRVLRKEVRKYKLKDKKAPLPLGLLDRIRLIDKELCDLRIDFAKTLHSIGAVGDKSKAASVHLHMSIPRPPSPEPPEVTEKVVLSSLIKTA